VRFSYPLAQAWVGRPVQGHAEDVFSWDSWKRMLGGLGVRFGLP
jgi:hypothetical protein